MIAVKRNGEIQLNGLRIGGYQKLTIGGYEIRLDGLTHRLGCHYYADIKGMVEANLSKLDTQSRPSATVKG